MLLVAALFLGINLYGTLGFMIIENAGLKDAFYMTVITITTVGYNEVIPLSEQGRFFAVSAIYLGLITSGFSVALLVNIFFEETLLEVLRGMSNHKRIGKLRDHFLVCGYGTTGQGIVQELLSTGASVVVIDKLKQEDVGGRLLFIQGDARQDEVLLKAGIGAAKGLASTLTEDADNVFVVLSARSLNAELVLVSRFKDDDTELKLKTAGVNHAVSPYRMGGHHLAKALSSGGSLEAPAVGDQCLSIPYQQLHLPADHPVKELEYQKAFQILQAQEALVIGYIDRAGRRLLNPKPNTPLASVSTLLLLCDESAVSSLRDHLLAHVSMESHGA